MSIGIRHFINPNKEEEEELKQFISHGSREISKQARKEGIIKSTIGNKVDGALDTVREHPKASVAVGLTAAGLYALKKLHNQKKK